MIAKKNLQQDLFVEFLSKILENQNQNIWIALEGSVCVGLIEGEIRPTLTHCANVGVIHQLYVHREYRERGIATALMIHLSAQFKKANCVQMTAFSTRVNVKSQEFLEHRGFTRTSHGFTKVLIEKVERD